MKMKPYCDLCSQCINDCKRFKDIKECVNFKQGLTRFEYKDMIREQNMNKRRFCKDYGLQLRYLDDMLCGKMHIKYKYHISLQDRLFEKEEYLPYIEKFQDLEGLHED